MENHEMKIRIPHTLWVRYKVVCLKKKLSISKQTEELVRGFVQNLEEELKIREKIGIY